MKSAALVLLTVLAFGLTVWGSDTPPNKFRRGPSHPQHTRTENTGRSHSSAAPVLSTKSQSARAKELQQIERKNTTHIQTRKAHSGKETSERPIHSERAGHSSAINFNYHPPQKQARGKSGSRKH
jgi:hypothetical protein